MIMMNDDKRRLFRLGLGLEITGWMLTVKLQNVGSSGAEEGRECP